MPENLPFPECGEISKTLYELVSKYNIEFVVFSFKQFEGTQVVTFTGHPVNDSNPQFVFEVQTDPI